LPGKFAAIHGREEVRSSILLSSTNNPSSETWGCLVFDCRPDDESGDRPGVTKAEAAETRELKKRNRILEEENLILRRAAAFFAKEMLPK